MLNFAEGHASSRQSARGHCGEDPGELIIPLVRLLLGKLEYFQAIGGKGVVEEVVRENELDHNVE